MNIPTDIIEKLRNDPEVRQALAASLKEKIMNGGLDFKDEVEILKLFKNQSVAESEEARIKALEDAIARNAKSRS